MARSGNPKKRSPERRAADSQPVRSRAPRAVAAVVVVAVVAAAAGVWAGSRTGTRVFEWARSANEVCARYAETIPDMELPGSLVDQEELAPFAAAVAERYAAFVADLSDIEAPGDAAEFAGEMIASVAGVGAAWEALSVRGEPLGPATDSFFANEIRAATASLQLAAPGVGAPACANPPTPGSELAAAELSEQEQQWAASVDRSCARFLTAATALDDEAGEAVAADATYLESMVAPTEALLSDIEQLGELDNEWRELHRGQWVFYVAEFADAAKRGDVADARQADRAWAQVASQMASESCALGVPPGNDTPTGYVATPSWAGLPALGLVNSEVFSAVQFSNMFSLTATQRPHVGIDPAEAFALRAVAADVLAGGALAGQEEASSTHLSLASPRPRSSGPASVENPYVVGVATMDVQNRCVWSALVGFPVPQEYVPLDAGDAACSGDAARDAYLASR